MKKILFAAIVFFIGLYGCGYTTHSVLPEGVRTIHVDNFGNKIDVTAEVSNRRIYYAYRPGMENDITRAVINRFIFDGIYQIYGAKEARFLLKGELVDFIREPLRYDSNDNVTEYRLHIAVNMELYDLLEQKTVWREKNFAGESTYLMTGRFSATESSAAQEAIDDLAVRIVERTVENW